jgi:hypothetical protein
MAVSGGNLRMFAFHQTVIFVATQKKDGMQGRNHGTHETPVSRGFQIAHIATIPSMSAFAENDSAAQKERAF